MNKWAQSNSDAIETAKQEILSRPEFSHDPSETDLVSDLTSFIGDLFSRLGDWSEGNPFGAKILILVLSLILILLIAHILYTIFSQIGNIRRTAQNNPRQTSAVVAMEGKAADWSEALTMARTAFENGDYRGVIWILHRLYLGILHQKSLVEFAGWKTNSDYLSECPASSQEFPFLAELTALYDRFIYGHDPIDGAPFPELIDRVQRAGEAS